MAQAQQEKTISKQGGFPVLGCGVGLRPPHYQHILDHWPQTIDWFEAVSENYMDSEGRPLRILEEVRKRYPIGLHGVALSIGSADPINQNYLEKLKRLADHIQPEIVSDHLCWTGIDHEELHDLLPLPFTEEAVPYLVARIDQVQSYLKRRILIENVSSYVTYKHSTIPEYQFITEIARRSGCGILLDINNIFVNATNHGFSVEEYLEGVPAELVGQFHVAGHLDRGKFLFDTHEGPITETVWTLYEKALHKYGQVSTLIEWDTDIPEFEKLEDENARSRSIYNNFSVKTSGEKARKISNQKNTEITHKEFQEELAKTQRWFRDHVQPQATEPHDSDIAELYLNPQAGDTGFERIQVYAEGYLAVNEGALAEVYESVKHLVGDGAFSRLAHDYALRYRSVNYNLYKRGEHLFDFLKDDKLSQKLPFLSDLAKLEYYKSLAYHAENRPSLKPEQFKEVPIEAWDHATVCFQPSVYVVRSKWPIHDLWKARKIALKDLKVKVEGNPQSVIICRPQLDIELLVIEPAEAQFLCDLVAGESLGNVCEKLSESSSGRLPPVMEWFQRWMSFGMICGVELNGAVNKKKAHQN